MTALDLLATGLVLAGALIMIGALGPVRRLMAHLAAGPLRQRWNIMTVLIGLFLVGYLAYVPTFWGRHLNLVDLIVPTIFLLGACFVWLTASLSEQTAADMLRVTRLELETVTDDLTGLFNRRHLDNRLAEEVARARRYGFGLSLIFLDIDHFKRINDEHGHAAGDRVLSAIAQRISQGLRDTDVAARFGGEEFVVIAPHTPLGGVDILARRLLHAIESDTFALPGTTQGLRVTCSAGIATLDALRTDAAALLDHADKNLYRAKQAGRNQVVGGSEREAALQH